MPPIQQNIIGLLVGFLVLTVTVFRSDPFFVTQPRTLILTALVMLGQVLIFGFLARLFGKPFWKGLVFLFVLETMLYGIMVISPRFYGPIMALPDGKTKAALCGFQHGLKTLHNRTWGNTVQHTLGQFDAQVGYVLRPGEGVYGNHGFENQYNVNSLGLRDLETALKNPDIIFLGDSFTMGWGVEQAEAFPQQMGKLMRKKTLNAGISSFGTARELLLLSRLPLDSCQTLVVQYCENDAVENQQFIINNYKISPDSLLFQASQRRNEYGRYFFLKYTQTLLGEVLKNISVLISPQSKQAASVANDPALNAEVQNFVLILKQMRARFGGKIVVIYVDAIGLPSKLPAFQKLAKAQLIENVNFVDVLSPLNANQHGLIYDDHLNAAAHLRIAKQLTGFLQKNE